MTRGKLLALALLAGPASCSREHPAPPPVPQTQEPQAQPATPVAPAAPAGNAARGRVPRGIYVYTYPPFIASGEFERSLAVKGVDGAAVVLSWADIEPTNGGYNFTELDRRVGLARAHGLAIELALLGGGGAPAWLYEPPPAGKGARRLEFSFSHHEGKGPCLKVVLSPPWGAAYQSAFGEMLEHVAAHLRETGALKDVSVVKLTGVNGDTDETRLPGETAEETGNPCVSDAVTAWRGAGYRPSLVVQAMRGAAASWARAFPDTWKVLPLILSHAFPPIAEDGQTRSGRGPTSQLDKTLVDEVVAAAEAVDRGHLIMQFDWLMTDKPARPRLMEYARQYGLPVAWQTNFYMNRQGKGAGCGGEPSSPVPCDSASYLRLLRAGIHPEGGAGPSAQGSFIEVFPPDALAFGDAIAAAHAEMVR